jgi:hypothetical protein
MPLGPSERQLERMDDQVHALISQLQGLFEPGPITDSDSTT